MSYFLKSIYEMIEEGKIKNEDSLKKFFLTDKKGEFVLDKKGYIKEDPNILKSSFLEKKEESIQFINHLKRVKEFKNDLFWDNLGSLFTTYQIEQEQAWDGDKELIIVRGKRDYSRIFQNILIIIIYLIMMPYLIIKRLLSLTGIFYENDSMGALYLMLFCGFVAFFGEEISNGMVNTASSIIEAKQGFDLIISMGVTF